MVSATRVHSTTEPSAPITIASTPARIHRGRRRRMAASGRPAEIPLERSASAPEAALVAPGASLVGSAIGTAVVGSAGGEAVAADGVGADGMVVLTGSIITPGHRRLGRCP
ncbi:hypothetical protein SDC9_111641 [bioreactor metagenome]|uniref:Uncharacterized protein n=1 Tax=bioreactor metagenome TaxID=1076179 RepID=A0A645BHK5_9ZZZZ